MRSKTSIAEAEQACLDLGMNAADVEEMRLAELREALCAHYDVEAVGQQQPPKVGSHKRGAAPERP